jgi:thioredoxin 1
MDWFVNRSKTFVVPLRDDQFDDFIADAALPVFVAFLADWSGPSRLLLPELEAFARLSRDQALVAKIDADVDPDTAERLRIRGVPTLVIFYKGREFRRQMGAMTRDDLSNLLEAVSGARTGDYPVVLEYCLIANERTTTP